MPKDNRNNNWFISLDDHELDIAEKRRAETGLSKAEFGRQALTNASVISRTNKEERAALMKKLDEVGNYLDQIVNICRNNCSDGNLSRVFDLDDKFTEIYNLISSKVQ